MSDAIAGLPSNRPRPKNQQIDRDTLRRRLLDAVSPSALGVDGYAVVDRIFDQIQQILKARFQQTNQQAELLLCDAKREAERRLATATDGLVELDWAIDDIVAELCRRPPRKQSRRIKGATK
jgi:hypothetical protein